MYKRQVYEVMKLFFLKSFDETLKLTGVCFEVKTLSSMTRFCLLYTSDAADERSSVDLGGRRIIKKKKKIDNEVTHTHQ